MKRGDPSPWGPVEFVQPFRHAPDGVVLVSTASHGGAWVPDAVAETMPEGLRNVGTVAKGGRWFEEDCCILAPMIAWPVPGTLGHQATADREAFRFWFPGHLDGPGCGVVTREGFHSCRKETRRT